MADAEEQRKLLSIFPTEIWYKICDEVNNPEDFPNLAYASTTFKGFLEARKPMFLFPVVLNFLDKNGYLSDNDTEDILTFRLVCHFWKSMIDKFLQARPYHCKLPGFLSNIDSSTEENRKDPAYNTHFHLYDFNIDELMNKILMEFSSPLYKSHCPFPSRHFTISETHIMDASQKPNDRHLALLHRYRTASVKFLEKVGHHFWHAKIEMHGGQLDWYKLLVKYANLMPNLRSLYITCSRTNLQFASNGDELTQFMATESLPFPVLKHLDLLNVSRIPSLALKEILNSGKIKNVAIDRGMNDEFQIAPVQSSDNLFLTLDGANELLLLPVFWKPKILRLYLKRVPSKSFNWSAFFHILENYSESLEELCFLSRAEYSETFNREIWECTLNHRLDLVKLKSLTFSVGKHICLDFLLGLKSLEYLSLRLPNITSSPMPDKSLTSKSVVNFMDCLHKSQIMKCNIWDLVPSLDKMVLNIGHIHQPQLFRRKNIF